MTEWIKVRAEAIRNAEKEKKTERDRQTVIATERKAKAVPYWNDLATVLEESVKQFNLEFSESERRIDVCDRSANAITIRRTAYPSAIVKVNLTPACTVIQYSISVTARKGANPVESQGNLTIEVINGEASYGEGAPTHDDVAKIFLEPFFEF